MQQEETVVVSNEPAAVVDEIKAEPEAKVEVAEEESPEQAEAKKQSKFQRRLDRHKTRAVAAETEARILREENAKLKAERPVKQEVEPKREEFEDYNEYVKAIAKHEAKTLTEQTLKSERDATQGKERQAQTAASEAKVTESWNTQEKAFISATPDYETKVNPLLDALQPGGEYEKLSPAARRMIMESDKGSALLYHLAGHEDDVERIIDLSPMRQVIELGKLEDKFQPATKATSKAPAPPNPSKGGATGTKDPAKMNMAEFKTYMSNNGSRYIRA